MCSLHSGISAYFYTHMFSLLWCASELALGTLISVIQSLHQQQYCDSCCRMFAMVVQRLFLADLQKVSGHTERKICAVGVTKILTEAPIMLQGDYEALWSVCVAHACMHCQGHADSHRELQSRSSSLWLYVDRDHKYY